MSDQVRKHTCLFFFSKEPKKDPEFKNPRVAKLFDKWRGVWLMSMDRQRKLQDALDRLNEVIFCDLPIFSSSQKFSLIMNNNKAFT